MLVQSFSHQYNVPLKDGHGHWRWQYVLVQVVLGIFICHLVCGCYFHDVGLKQENKKSTRNAMGTGMMRQTMFLFFLCEYINNYE